MFSRTKHPLLKSNSRTITAISQWMEISCRIEYKEFDSFYLRESLLCMNEMIDDGFPCDFCI